MQTVSKVAVANQAGCDIQFEVMWTGGETQYTGYYPIDQTNSIDLKVYSIPTGTQVQPRVHAAGGEHKSGGFVIYDPNSSNTATYTVTGGG